jgi:hypothetical protein
MIISTTGLLQAQTNQLNKQTNDSHIISSSDLRIANQIFIEHRASKKIIVEQQEVIKGLETSVGLYKQKDSINLLKLQSKDTELQLNNQIFEVEKTALQHNVTTQKAIKNQYKILTIALTALSIFLIAK